MIEQVSLTINLCDSDKSDDTHLLVAGNPFMPTVIMSVFLLFLYLNGSNALSLKTKEDFVARLRSAYNNKRLFINTKGTCASNTYLFLGAHTTEAHSLTPRLGHKDAIVNGKVFTNWLLYSYRDITAIKQFADTHKSSKDYNDASNKSLLAMYFLEHLDTVLQNIAEQQTEGRSFFTYMSFDVKQDNISVGRHAVVVWYDPVDANIFIINPQDFISDGRIVYGAGNNWRDYFGAGIRHYSLHKYVEDNIDFFAGLGHVSLLTEFHTDTEPFKGGSSNNNNSNNYMNYDYDYDYDAELAAALAASEEDYNNRYKRSYDYDGTRAADLPQYGSLQGNLNYYSSDARSRQDEYMRQLDEEFAEIEMRKQAEIYATNKKDILYELASEIDKYANTFNNKINALNPTIRLNPNRPEHKVLLDNINKQKAQLREEMDEFHTLANEIRGWTDDNKGNKSKFRSDSTHYSNLLSKFFAETLTDKDEYKDFVDFSKMGGKARKSRKQRQQKKQRKSKSRT